MSRVWPDSQNIQAMQLSYLARSGLSPNIAFMKVTSLGTIEAIASVGCIPIRWRIQSKVCCSRWVS
ncbi:hypothetical protein H6G96_34780 [Nostoc sp. FACHB-892]|uniref:hypothetical protein n=1 Tax=Nostoc sp. FACHB-892 TaxID=2692843 RepID=UPI001683DBBC|nr:hypothetical protein [Nostoc sp. FACHB-892]MBD2731337.1 hypothetical protein [Nostoc sp. FACHB-892]